MRQILMQGMGKFQLQNVWAPDPGWRGPWWRHLGRSKTESETIGDAETTIQKLFPAIQNLLFRNLRDSEPKVIQKLSRFGNYHDSETIELQKLQFRN